MQNQKISMSKKKFRIGELARELKVKKFVVRFWEKEFCLQSDRSQGGQRFYTDEDLQTFFTIKSLLYEEGYTIAGAKIQLQKTQKNSLTAAKLTENNFESYEEPTASPQLPKEFFEKLNDLKRELLELKKQLS